ncbi:hypothetical protein BJ508DRAFT_347830 [Ascobolus immersus RN42]|uniref:Uncharacterized protein n=1 Tax=Ascobolus immersus RN42 TaxID=1160509 RepID=A0A3N4I2Z9_ASCIM|nr:hypothetical protein BJ508DRAFT_347830 [Ascobolus immersus RN42]
MARAFSVASTILILLLGLARQVYTFPGLLARDEVELCSSSRDASESDIAVRKKVLDKLNKHIIDQFHALPRRKLHPVGKAVCNKKYRVFDRFYHDFYNVIEEKPETEKEWTDLQKNKTMTFPRCKQDKSGRLAILEWRVEVDKKDLDMANDLELIKKDPERWKKAKERLGNDGIYFCNLMSVGPGRILYPLWEEYKVVDKKIEVECGSRWSGAVGMALEGDDKVVAVYGRHHDKSMYTFNAQVGQEALCDYYENLKMQEERGAKKSD